ncbi:LysR substrate-binding domain-containing protein (plasmid) [Ensifer adhaerens]|uniref:LysR family transcriptional regulator n=1 Tax=Ensifer adhaerens TaxID=106592 RepID=UPI0023A96EA8|nr:LysR family transcriptional regulator [Ensifer adhaerens]WDZ81448.1 LysR substrate-binding domain-containing protein [Ensifer adhaerens]
MRNIDLDSLQIFRSVVETGSITGAAAQLRRVQSNVTTRIQNLEERLGVKLFQRQRNRLVLSSDGQILLTYAERLLRLSAEAEAALKTRGPSGTLRIGTLESTAAARLPPLLSAFHARYPDVQIELVTGDSSTLLRRVRHFDVEAALVSEPFDTEGLATQVAFAEELALIAPLSMPPIRDACDVRGRTIIAFAAGCSYRRILEDWLAMSKIVPERVLEFASYHAIVACVAAGSGIAIMPRSVLRAVHAEGQVQISPLPPEVADVRTHLIWCPGHHSSALDALRSELGASYQ